MKITIISPFTFGYIDALVHKLEKYPNVDVIFIKTEKLYFEYDSFLQRCYNFYLKNFKGRNLKKEFKIAEILARIDKGGEQDYILILRPDLLQENLLTELKFRTKRLISFYFDGIENIPGKLKLIRYFDRVYSYEKIDVENMA